MQEELFYNALNVALDSDYKKIEVLQSKFSSWEAAWQELMRAKKTLPDPQKEWQGAERLGVRLMFRESPLYPPLLKEIPQPPFGIYVLGTLPQENLKTLAIVGTRKATVEGKGLAKKFAAELAERGFAIISGLALGIDAAAHEGCLEAKGKTVAVLGNGLDYFYPRTNERLAKRILAEGGSIISEYPIGAKPLPYRFLERNRIVSGLADGVLVVEAPENSGALVTANHALDQNRQVFVIPGPISHPNYIGSNRLIRSGAELVTKTEDILEAFNIETSAEKTSPENFETPEEQKVYEALKKFSEPASIDKILAITDLSASEANRAITYLIIKNVVKETGGGCYTMQ
jgi:DNA processing protein